MTTIDDVVNRLRAEFLEMPGLRLTSGQVQRLCGVEKTLCQLGLDSLVETKFLYVKSDGVYALTTHGELSRPRMARAVLGLPARLVRAS
jgi:hypothetical protein